MALTRIQREILGVLSRNRSPNSHFAGGATMNVENARVSRDFDIFHDAAASVRDSAERDFRALIGAGFAVADSQRSRPERGFVEAVVGRGSGRDREETEIQWVVDSAVRFFPVIEDDEFGWRLHDFDLAINKVLALAGRREPRDYYDIVALGQRGVGLASLIWAAPAKDPGFTPDLLLDEIMRNSSYSEAEMRAKIDAEPFPDLVEMKRVFLQAIHRARAVIEAAPMGNIGLLYLDQEGGLVEPNAAESGGAVSHGASVGGSWPVFPESTT